MDVPSNSLNSKNLKFEIIKKLSETTFKTRDLMKGKKISRIDTISPPSVFVGSKLQYPKVNVGILSPLDKDEDAWVYDAEKYWAEKDFGIREVMNLRGSLLNSRFQSKVTDVRVSNSSFGNNKFVEIAKDIAVAYKPVDVEVEFKRNLVFDKNSVGRDNVVTPHGMKAPLKNAQIVGNVKIHSKVDRVINDDLKASEGIKYLYKNNFNEYSLNKILSVGVLGLKKNKKFVPTRWSITATDDNIGKQLLEEIKDFRVIENWEMFLGEFLGNQYLIMLFPNVWTYELFELYYPGSSWNPSKEMKASTDYEDFYGRKEYASATAGGYYATRLPILEYLKEIKRQASVLVIRLETPTYWAGLGVWVVRESVRKALSNGARKFNDKEEFMESAKKIAKIKYDFDANLIFEKSILLKNLKTQRNLREWF